MVSGRLMTLLVSTSLSVEDKCFLTRILGWFNWWCCCRNLYCSNHGGMFQVSAMSRLCRWCFARYHVLRECLKMLWTVSSQKLKSDKSESPRLLAFLLQAAVWPISGTLTGVFKALFHHACGGSVRFIFKRLNSMAFFFFWDLFDRLGLLHV